MSNLLLPVLIILYTVACALISQPVVASNATQLTSQNSKNSHHEASVQESHPNHNTTTHRPRKILLPKNAQPTRRLDANHSAPNSDNTKEKSSDHSAASVRRNYAISPSTLSSIYDYLNRKKEKQPALASNKAPNKKLPFALISDLQQDQFYARQPVALGTESEPFKSVQLDGTELGTPIVLQNGPNTLVGDGETANELFHKQPMQQPSNQEEQILASLYMNELNNQQQILLPHQLNELNLNGGANAHYAGSASDIYDMQQKNNLEQQHFFAHPMQVKPLVLAKPKQSFSEQHRAKAPTNKRNPQLKHDPALRQGQAMRSPENEQGPKKKKKDKMLSNDQLSSLIDELKEFNSRQAKKIHSGINLSTDNRPTRPSMAPVIHPFGAPMLLNRDPLPSKIHPARPASVAQKLVTRPSPPTPGSPNHGSTASNKNKTLRPSVEVDNDDEPNASPSSSSDNKGEQKQREPEEESNAKEADSEDNDGKQQSKMTADDLAQFAKFLMTKEGANLKFQLGLDKSERDDGDEEDDKDVLLESKKNPTKARPRRGQPNKGKAVESLDKKQQEASAQMDNLMNGLAQKAKFVDRAQKRKEALMKATKSLNDDDKNEKARKRRDQQIYTTNRHSTQEVVTKSVIPGPPPEVKKPPRPSHLKDDEENFAKMLIKQEILEDKHEALLDPPKSSTKKVEKYGGKKNNKDSVSSKASQILNDAFADSSLPVSRVEEGENNYEYPKNERNDDHVALRGELQKARKTKSKTRDRLPMAVDKILRRALDGDMGMQSERLPDGRLTLNKNDKDVLMTLNLPATSLKDGEISSAGDSSLSNLDEPRGPEVLDKVKIQSQSQLKDEYPISERVSDRLDKLSNNLDRYFNDGFLQEIETKSGVGGDKSIDLNQPQSSNVNEASKSAEAVKKEETSKSPKVDHDFDIDVGIDGRRDLDRYDEDKDDDIEDERAEKSASNNRARKKSKEKKGGKKPRRETEKSGSEKGPKVPDNVDDKSVRRGETIKSENIEFENQGKIIPNLDPVENESMETPIGPDVDNTELPDLSTSTEVKSVKGTNVSRSYGGKTKFYEEPDWT